MSVAIAAGGDLIPHPAVLTTAQANAGGSGYDFSPMFAQVKPILSKADVAICQMETPLSVDDKNVVRNFPTQYPRFTGPHEMASDAKAAGFDGCSTANNHAYDADYAGLAATRTVFAQTGLKASGPAPEAADRVAWYDVKGVKIAQLSYSYTLNNASGNQTYVPPAAPWLTNNLYSVKKVDGIVADANAARAAGADFVVVSMHWGVEQTRTLSNDQRTLGPALLKSGAVDYIIGNHPHVVQQCTKVDGRYVVNSHGNMLSQQGPPYFKPMANDGVITTVTLTRDTTGKVSEKLSFQPTYVDRADKFTIKLATRTSNPASYDRTVAAMTAGGSCDATPAS